ncbi:MAG: elongation factor Ts [candidate division Zixibacteria bacterium SM23_73_2]|nr:MAG: elongation factor Ts [candidate division Zixibacteria bacterium SM23_73_2]
MTEIDAKLVKELREKTGAGIMDCKKALEKSEGEIDKAVDHLREQGMARAAKKATRVTKEGTIYSYIHPGDKLGVLVEINCETDFVAKTEDFKNLVKDIAMQIAATNPLVVNRDELREEIVQKEKDIYKAQAKSENKPDKIIDRIIQGKLEKYFQEVCLLEQPFIKDEDCTVQERISEVIAKLGENIAVKRFARFRLGE